MLFYCFFFIKAQLKDSRQQHRDTEITKKRELSLIGGKMQIVSRIKDEEERKALFTGDSLRVTTLQSAEERRQHREALIQENNALLITASNRDIEPINSSNDSNELSEYSLFEARRKAEAEKSVAVEHPKLSSLHPISRPKKPAPVFQTEENTLESVSVLNLCLFVACLFFLMQTFCYELLEKMVVFS